jgi:hypothetical protein
MASDKTYIQLLEMAKDELNTHAEGIIYQEFRTRLAGMKISQHPELLWNFIYGINRNA